MAIIAGRIRAGLAPNEAPFAVNGHVVFVTEVWDRDAVNGIDQARVLLAFLGLVFGFEYLTVQCASVSFCAALAGSSGQMSVALSPALAHSFSSFVIRWRGAETKVASTIWPPVGL